MRLLPEKKKLIISETGCVCVCVWWEGAGGGIRTPLPAPSSYFVFMANREGSHFGLLGGDSLSSQSERA